MATPVTQISLIQAADVAVLKCIYFQLVNTYKSMLWYDIDCNFENTKLDIDKAFVYLQSISFGCPLTHEFECEIKTFISKKSSFCVFSLPNQCTETYTVEFESFLLTEANDNIITESSDNLIIE